MWPRRKDEPTRLSQSSDFFLDLVSGRKRGPGASALRLALRAASLPYRAAVGVRNLAFDRGWKTIHRVGVPVVSVGNLTVGGTGKTPCVEYLARYFRVRGVRVAVLSRGYGSADGPNDEALVLEENLPDVPHLQGADRADLAGTAVEELESEVLILDDGFQHRRLHRDLDVVLIDATCPWGHGWLLPGGLLREPARSLRRAHAVILTRCDLAGVERGRLREEVRRIAPRVVVAEAVHRPQMWVNADGRTEPVGAFAGRAVAGVCGIGNPQAFRRTLEGVGVTVSELRTYPDHHPYTRADIDDLTAWAAKQPADGFIATTQKDLVKMRLPALAGRELWALRIGLEFLSGEAELHRLLAPFAADNEPL